MFSDEEAYRKRVEELTKRLDDPKIGGKIEGYMKKIAILTDCTVELKFNIEPHAENYDEIQSSEDYVIPDNRTMKLNDFITYLQRENDKPFDIYIDPIYLKDGVNEIEDILMSTIDKKLIIVPIANKKTINL